MGSRPAGRKAVLRRTLLLLPSILVAASLLLTSCGGGNSGGPVKVTIWHSMPSLALNVLKRIADQFNASQTQYKVDLIFQGDYSDSLNKLISSLGSGNIPAVIQLSDVSTQIMIDSGKVTPVQQFIDAEHYDLSDFEPKPLAYYTEGNTLYAMPFNLSGPILYYDRKAFVEAGLDPDKPPRTLAELRQYSEKLVHRSAPGPAHRSGIASEISSWFFEEMLAKAGGAFVNNGNGRDGRATAAAFDGPEGKGIIEWWDQMVKDGLMYKASDAVDALLKLGSGETAMAIASTAALRGAIAALTIAGRDPKQYDAAPLPGPNSPNGGITPGGAAFWILKDRPKEEQRGAWEFLKFASSPEQQAQWHADTGYFPSRISAFNLPPAVEARQQFPQFEIALRQLHDSPENRATEGALVGSFSAIRQEVEQAFERALGGGADPDQALEAAAKAATKIIKDYNRTAP